MIPREKAKQLKKLAWKIMGHKLVQAVFSDTLTEAYIDLVFDNNCRITIKMDLIGCKIDIECPDEEDKNEPS